MEARTGRQLFRVVAGQTFLGTTDPGWACQETAAASNREPIFRIGQVELAQVVVNGP